MIKIKENEKTWGKKEKRWRKEKRERQREKNKSDTSISHTEVGEFETISKEWLSERRHTYDHEDTTHVAIDSGTNT